MKYGRDGLRDRPPELDFDAGEDLVGDERLQECRRRLIDHLDDGDRLMNALAGRQAAGWIERRFDVIGDQKSAGLNLPAPFPWRRL